VLGTPPAFVLSQDQTLQLNGHTPSRKARRADSDNGVRHIPTKLVTLLAPLAEASQVGVTIQFSKTDRSLAERPV
jgi:hypothetical protein